MRPILLFQDYSLYNMLDMEEYEESTQISPFSDPRKCRMAGCMNLASPLTGNFCDRCYASLPPAAYVATNGSSSAKCKSQHCDNAGDSACRGFCYHCFHSTGL